MRLWLYLTALCLLGHAAPGTAHASLLVSDLEGVSRLESQGALTLLATISGNTTVVLEPGARLVLTDLSGGREFVLGGPGRFRVVGSEVRSEAGSAPVTRPLAAAGLPPVKVSSQIALAAVRMRSLRSCASMLGGAEAAIYPNLTAVALPLPKLRWAPVLQAEAYQVSVRDDAGNLITAGRASVAEWKVPETASFDPGRSYTWVVQALNRDAPIGSPLRAVFTLLSGETSRLLERLRPQPDAPVSQRVLYAAQLQEAGLWLQACEQWQRLRQERPDDVGIDRLLK